MGKQQHPCLGHVSVRILTTALLTLGGLIAIGCDDRRDQTILPSAPNNVQKTGMAQQPPTRQVAWNTPPSNWKGVQTQQQGEIAFSVSEKDPNLLVRGFLINPATPLEEIVNQWEKQLGRTPSDRSAVEATVTKATVINGIPAKYVDLTSPDGAAEKKRLVGAIVLDPQSKVTFVLAGPEEGVTAEKTNFDLFVNSIRFVMVQPTAQGGGAGGPIPFRLKFGQPPNWRKDPSPPGGIDMILRTGEGTQEAAIVVTRQSAETAQSYIDDPNKLRALAMLSPLAAGEKHSAYKVQVGSQQGQGLMFDLRSNPGETPYKQTLFAIVPVNGMAVCVQLAGAAEAVQKHTPELGVFLQSLEFVPLNGPEAAIGPRVPLPLLDQLMLPPSMKSPDAPVTPSTQAGAAQ